MTEEPPKKKSLAGLGQMIEKAAAKEKAAKAPVTRPGAIETEDYVITFRKNGSI
ncbi:hypothetical protein [Rhizobium sp. HT1-10]|uniref:hypothetical protein n=1 Tax=Rhizobium sp. HT1-10 TaxID=3111638 RepID=UPI003C2A16A3